jgi:hypothetical protein
MINDIWYVNPMHSDIAMAPSSVKSTIMGDFHSYSQAYSSSCDVSPTIHFGSLIFEHQGDFNLKLTRIEDPGLTRAGQEVFTLFSQFPFHIYVCAAVRMLQTSSGALQPLALEPSSLPLDACRT